MNYTITASSIHNNKGTLHLKESTHSFGISNKTKDTLSSPVDLYLSALAACILKNVERFSTMMHFEYETTTIEIKGTHCLKPSRIENIVYTLIITSKDANKINSSLLKRNLEKFGTIYYMISQSCAISGTITLQNA